MCVACKKSKPNLLRGAQRNYYMMPQVTLGKHLFSKEVSYKLKDFTIDRKKWYLWIEGDIDGDCIVEIKFCPICGKELK